MLSLPTSDTVKSDDVRDDPKTVEELRAKVCARSSAAGVSGKLMSCQLDEANAALAQKNETVTTLLDRAGKAESALSAAQAEIAQQKSLLDTSEEAKAKAQGECTSLRERLAALEEDRSHDQSALEVVRDEVREPARGKASAANMLSHSSRRPGKLPNERTHSSRLSVTLVCRSRRNSNGLERINAMWR